MQLLTDNDKTDQAKTAEKELAELTDQLNQVETQIRQSCPRYSALKYPQPLSLPEIQNQVLDRDTLLLEFALGKERSYLWAITNNKVYNYRLPRREVIESAARKVYALITARSQQIEFETEAEQQVRIAQADAEYPIAARQLSQLILTPVATHLGRKRLLIVADGALHYIPFSALPVPRQNSGSAITPLLAEHDIVYLPSATTIAMQRQQLSGRSLVDNKILVIADPVFSPDDERITKNKTNDSEHKPLLSLSDRFINDQMERSAQESGITRGSKSFSRLRFTRQEAEGIETLVNDLDRKIALDFDANLKTVTDPTINQYRIIHFAIHGFLNCNHPELSGLVLSLVDQRGEPQLGFLPAYVVFNLNLSTDLVVLSACQTGLGKEI
ncbi:MAG: CHAT domain-containing protein, partial [Acidobacteriota bacterium]